MSRSKICAHCKSVVTVAFRIRLMPDKNWIFVCKLCCEKSAKISGYQYGGTWKS